MFEGLPLLEPVWWNWYLAGVLLMLLELVVPGAIIVWFGVGALATGFITELFGGLYWPIQLLLFSALSLLSLLAGRRVIKRAAPAKTPTLNRRLHRYLGRHTKLRTAIENGTGRIRLDDTYWTVHGPDMPAGTTVEIVGVEDSTLVVAKADFEL